MDIYLYAITLKYFKIRAGTELSGPLSLLSDFLNLVPNVMKNNINIISKIIHCQEQRSEEETVLKESLGHCNIHLHY
jgi:hypothetical protein